MKDAIGYLGGAVAVLVLLHYALNVFRGIVPADSIATWAMWFITDVQLLVMTWQAHKPIWLPLGWTVGALLVAISLLRDGKWRWSTKETISASCALIATIVWRTQGAEIGVVAGTVALVCGGIPLLLDMLDWPERSTFYVWFFTCVACVCTLLASDWTLVGTSLAWGSLVYNAAMCFVVRRLRAEYHAVVRHDGTITLPNTVMRRLKVGVGESIRFCVIDGKVTVRKKSPSEI